LYLLALETHFLTKQLQKYKNSYNKLDKNLATLLFDAVDTISEFLKDVQVQESDEKFDVFEIIPSIDSEICEAHRYFRCKACNLNVRASSKSFNEHFYGTKHLKKLREFEKSMTKPKDFQRHTLKGSSQSLSESVASLNNNRQAPKKKERLNSAPSKSLFAADQNLPKKMIEFMSTTDIDSYTASLLNQGNYILKSDIHIRVCNLLQRQLHSRFPEVKAYPFGSMVIGLGRPKGDLDIFVDISKCYFSKPSKRIMKNAIHKTQEVLRSNGNNWGDFEPVTKARTPILRVFCRAEGIDCDLSFSNGLSSCNTALISYFINLQPVCKKLVMFVKTWASSLQLGINSYLVSLIVIFYLQQERLLPSVEEIQSTIDPV
jgi:DNA polymerase sigma